MKNTRSKTKPVKTGKEFGTRYYLGCKDYTDNFKPQKVKMSWRKIKICCLLI